MAKPIPFKTVAEAWEFFSKSVIAKGTSEKQVTDLRKTFYAGASCFYDIIMDNAEYPEDVATRRLAALHMEFVKFAEELRKAKMQ
jgi:hypothetical protein